MQTISNKRDRLDTLALGAIIILTVWAAILIAAEVNIRQRLPGRRSDCLT